MKLKHKKIIILFSIFIILLISYKLFNKLTYSAPNQNLLEVHFIDVGQGDSILVRVNNKNLLIDAGPEKSQKQLNKYLNSLQIQKLDYIIATHPHEDHIGNMSFIIDKYKIGKFFAPKVTADTKSFENMIDSLLSKSLKVNVIDKDTNSINLGPNTSVTIYSPNKDFSSDNLNLYSPFIKIQYKNISFLFTGDGEIENEAEIIKSNLSLKATVLKVGHHGSSTSTSTDFLKSVSPTIAVISVGKKNNYNHPTESVLKNLDEYCHSILRTDLLGSIKLISDGYKIYKSPK